MRLTLGVMGSDLGPEDENDGESRLRLMAVPDGVGGVGEAEDDEQGAMQIL